MIYYHYKDGINGASSQTPKTKKACLRRTTGTKVNWLVGSKDEKRGSTVVVSPNFKFCSPEVKY